MVLFLWFMGCFVSWICFVDVCGGCWVLFGGCFEIVFLVFGVVVVVVEGGDCFCCELGRVLESLWLLVWLVWWC